VVGKSRAGGSFSELLKGSPNAVPLAAVGGALVVGSVMVVSSLVGAANTPVGP